MPGPRVLGITRFTVMATLQAARALQMGLSEESAFSWGLNRAIFYAAAKRGFRGTPASGRPGEPAPAEEAGRAMYSLGNDRAYRDTTVPGLLFTIGGETQTEDQFRKQVATRFRSEANFRRAWKEALEVVGQFDEEVLGSGPQFYSTVYRPRRDALVAKWAEEFNPRAERGATSKGAGASHARSARPR